MKGSTDSIQCNVYHPITQDVTVSYYAPGTSAGQILSEIYTNRKLLEYVTLTVDGETVDVDTAGLIYPQKSVDIEVQPGAAVVVPLLVSAVVGYISYRYVKSKFGNQAEAEEIDTIRNQRNQEKRYDPVPIVIGERRVVPDLAALPWTEVEGDQQYLNVLLSVCHAPVRIEDIRIGDTSITEFGDDVELEIYDGYDNPSDITLFSQDVVEEDIGFEFKSLRSEVRTTAEDTDRIVVDNFFPIGLWRQSSSGGTGGTQTGFRVEYRAVGDSEWILQRQWREVRSQTKAFFVTTDWTVPRGQYEVRVTLYDSELDRRRRNNTFRWESLKSFRNSDPVSTRGAALIAMRVRADERTSGGLDRVNCLVKGLVPENWNDEWSDWRPMDVSEQVDRPDSFGGNWAGWLQWQKQIAEWYQENLLKESSNPADWFRWITQGPFISKKVTNEKFDLEQLDYFRDFCITNGFEVNAEIVNEKTLGEILNKIAGTSLGELIVKGGQYSVAIDEPKDFYSAVYTFKNAADLSFEREFLEEIDGYRFQFDNKETNYEEDEIIITLPGKTTTSGNFERVQRWGITNYEQAYTVGRHLLAEREVRQEAYAFTANIQSVDVTRGDLVLVQIPTIGIGISSGRVIGIGSSSITVDERSEIEDSSLSHAVLIIKPNNDVAIKDVISTDGTTLELNNTTGIEVGDRFSFGVKDNETRECLVREVEPADDLSFDLKLVNYGPEIFDIDGEEIPQYDAVVNLPDTDDLLPEPTIRYIRTFRTRNQTETGEWKVNVDVGYSYSTTYGSGSFQVQLEYREQGETVWTDLGFKDSQQSTFTIEGLKDRRVYDFRIRTRGDGSTSRWVEQSRFIESDSAEDPPLPKVNGLQLYGTKGNEFEGNDIKLVWRPTSLTRSYELGGEPAGADDGGYDPYFKDYLVEVVDPDTNEIIREEYVKDTQYNYSYEKNVEDGGPRRRVRFRVYLRGNNNQISEQAAKITVNNPQPPLHTGFNVGARFSGVEVRWNDNPDLDFRGTSVYIGEQSGFEPDESNLVYDGPDNQVQIGGLSGDTTYYLVYEVYDSFGRELANRSGEFEFTTLSLTTDLDLGAWAEVDIGTREEIEDWLSGEAPDPQFIPRIAAGQIVSGVIQATELIESEGIIRAVDDINNPSFETVFGPQTVDGKTWLQHAKFSNTTDIIFGVDEFGGATFSGAVTITGGSGIASLADAGGLATKNQAESGDVTFNYAGSSSKGGNAIDTDSVNALPSGVVGGLRNVLDDTDITATGWYRAYQFGGGSGRGSGTLYVSYTGGSGGRPGRAIFSVDVDWSSAANIELTLLSRHPSMDSNLRKVRVTNDGENSYIDVEVDADSATLYATYIQDSAGQSGAVTAAGWQLDPDVSGNTEAVIDFQERPRAVAGHADSTERGVNDYIENSDGDVFIKGNKVVDGTNEPGANITENHTSANTSNVGGKPASEVEDGVDRAASGLDPNGFVAQAIQGDILPATNPSSAQLSMTNQFLGFWDGSEWTAAIENNGNFFFQGDSNNFITWDGNTLDVRGTLNADDLVAGTIDAIDITGSTITGSTLRTSSSGERFEVSASDNKARFVDSSENEQVTIGPTTEDEGTFAIRVRSEANGVWSYASGTSNAAFYGVNSGSLRRVWLADGFDAIRAIGSVRVDLPTSGDEFVVGDHQVLRSGPAGAIGTPAFARIVNNETFFGQTRSGSDLNPTSGFSQSESTTLSGTWRCLGYAADAAGGDASTLWIKIAD